MAFESKRLSRAEPQSAARTETKRERGGAAEHPPFWAEQGGSTNRVQDDLFKVHVEVIPDAVEVFWEQARDLLSAITCGGITVYQRGFRAFGVSLSCFYIFKKNFPPHPIRIGSHYPSIGVLPVVIFCPQIGFCKTFFHGVLLTFSKQTSQSVRSCRYFLRG